MSKKIRKTLYLPEWLADILDLEGEAYDGPGVVASASIQSFSEMDKKNKIATLKNFRSKEIEIAYKQDYSKKDEPTIRGITLADYTLCAHGVISEERLKEIWDSTPKTMQKEFTDALQKAYANVSHLVIESAPLKRNRKKRKPSKS